MCKDFTKQTPVECVGFFIIVFIRDFYGRPVIFLFRKPPQRRLLCKLGALWETHLFRSNEMKTNLSFGTLLTKTFYSVRCTCLGIENTPPLISSVGIRFLFTPLSSSFKDVINVSIYLELVLWKWQWIKKWGRAEGGKWSIWKNT